MNERIIFNLNLQEVMKERVGVHNIKDRNYCRSKTTSVRFVFAMLLLS